MVLVRYKITVELILNYALILLFKLLVSNCLMVLIVFKGRTAGFCALCAIQNHVRNALQSTGKILSPFHLVKNLRCILQNNLIAKYLTFLFSSLGNISFKFLIVHLTKGIGISRNFRSCRQEDAHEYMVNLLESMHKCCLPYGVSSESPAAYEKSLVHKIFGGSLRSQVRSTIYGSSLF